MTDRRPVRLRTVAAGALAAAVGVAAALFNAPVAAEFPSQTVRWVVPYGAGGAYDRLARGLGPILSKQLGVSVVVENITGPDGYNRIYRAAPDGHTIGIADPLGEYARKMIAPPPYKIEEFTWIGRINGAVNLIVASARSDIRSFEDLRTHQRPVRVSIFGVAAPLVQPAILSSRTGFDIAFVNFPTVGEALFGVVRGDADIGVLGVTPWLEHIEKKSVYPLLLWSEEPDPRLPGVPHLGEIGQGELVTMLNHRSILTTPGVPPEVKQKLTEAFRATVDGEEGRAYLEKQRFETNSLWGEEFEKTIQAMWSTIEQHGAVLKQAVQ